MSARHLELSTVMTSPGDLSMFCPRVVLEGSSFVVACETETVGSPTAIVRLEGEKDRQKVISSVPRTANGTQFRCHVTWGGDTNSTSNYTLLIDICVLPHRHLLVVQSELSLSPYY
ncbi:hypothetical protein C0Q70_12682 [Pomacea canaliculata]|uniref:Ig-like domain-containing protein n=1 Tax=Pomacea canaliculata TaxID=400727 RepID=A0A2T7P285_POMCA|nr:hypothetical protein C0Q70_12682 [Pomacea canaliculata]